MKLTLGGTTICGCGQQRLWRTKLFFM